MFHKIKIYFELLDPMAQAAFIMEQLQLYLIDHGYEIQNDIFVSVSVQLARNSMNIRVRDPSVKHFLSVHTSQITQYLFEQKSGNIHFQQRYKLYFT